MASYIGRRKFLATLGGAVAWPLAAPAQQSAVPVIGFLHPTSLEAFAENLRGFRQGLKEIDGKRKWGVPFSFSPVPCAMNDTVPPQLTVQL